MPGPAAAAVDVGFRLNLTVKGTVPAGDRLELIFISAANRGTRTEFPFCGTNVPPSLQLEPAVGPCKDGTTYPFHFFVYHPGDVITIRYQLVTAAGVVSVFYEQTFTVTRDQTFSVTYNVGGLPDAAMAPKADRPEGMLRALGFLMLLVAATVLTGTARRKRELWRPGAGRPTSRQQATLRRV